MLTRGRKGRRHCDHECEETGDEEEEAEHAAPELEMGDDPRLTRVELLGGEVGAGGGDEPERAHGVEDERGDRLERRPVKNENADHGDGVPEQDREGARVGEAREELGPDVAHAAAFVRLSPRSPASTSGGRGRRSRSRRRYA